LYDLIQTNCNQDPTLIISIFGGGRYLKMNEQLENDVINGVIKAATIASNVT